ncbi:cysteine desulfurase family protein [Erysipelothrix urinaevulpis]|uniref:cysteine desulfurase family protein n=1 Tax=Erysipelothrix urinaevulpis TaxID=2683717 RepID=UPI00135C1B02|nr:cysteine desulfurase family protein [Erysipelothrix urinaevulpis]
MQKVHNNPIYLDSASTVPMREEIIEDAAVLMKKYYANADSLHHAGQRVSRLILQSQEKLAKDLSVLPHEIFYTSGASESNSWALQGVAFANQDRGKHIITSEIEHASILNTCKVLEETFGFEVDYLPVNDQGVVEVDVLKKTLREDTILVSLFAINNEIGSINNLSELAKTIRKHSSAFFHVDGVQALGKHPISMKQIDMISYSAHKIGGLKGSGLLIKRAGVKILPIIHGGQQQEALRGGTTNSPAVILWSKTLRLALEDYHKNHEKVREMYRYLWEFFSGKEGIEIHSFKDSSPYIFNVSVLNVDSEIMMNALNHEGIYVSAQSTCHSKNTESHVLLALGKSKQSLKTNVRLSLSSNNTMEEIVEVCEKIMEIKEYVKH